MKNKWYTKNNLINVSKTITVQRLPLLAFLCGIILLSCSQDSIFYDISIEPVPKVALIGGTPTNMAVVNGMVYVGTRMGNRIYYYNGARWAFMGTPGGALGELATDGTYLYAIVFPNGEPTKSSIIKRYNFSESSWDADISAPGYSIQTLYCAGNGVFAGCQQNSDRYRFAIMSCDTDLSSSTIYSDSTSLLTGAVEFNGATYLATAGNGVLKYDGSAVSPIPENRTSGAILKGIITTADTGGMVVAVGNDSNGNGSIYYSTDGSSFEVLNTGNTFTGALGIWKKYNYDTALPETWHNALLLLGTHGSGSSLTHGYREMVLNTDGTFYDNSIKYPGDGDPTSVTSRAKYEAALGVNPVQAILQVPDLGPDADGKNYYPDMTLPENKDWVPMIFASTAQNGLWSYKNEQWNAED